MTVDEDRTPVSAEHGTDKCVLCNDPVTPTHSCLKKEDEVDFKVGEVIDGNWKVLSVLGVGGMGTVLKVENLKDGGEFALKVVHSRLLTDKAALNRFRQEAQLAEKLSHPNIIASHCSGVDEKQRPYLVVDLLEGTSLDLRLEKGPMSLDEGVPVMIKVAKALEYAHEQGVIHRDLKPSNVMLVTGEDGTLKVKLVDFGIAKILPKLGSEEMKLTATGDIVGSPYYMSPEQCMALGTTALSDMYSMGCLIYATLTGQPPFLNFNVYETYYQHINDMPQSVSKLAPEIKNASAVDALICKCMAKEPKDRYQSMALLINALNKLSAQDGNSTIMSKVATEMQVLDLKIKATKLLSNEKKSKKARVLMVVCFVIGFIIMYFGAGAIQSLLP